MCDGELAYVHALGIDGLVPSGVEGCYAAGEAGAATFVGWFYVFWVARDTVVAAVDGFYEFLQYSRVSDV